MASLLLFLRVDHHLELTGAAHLELAAIEKALHLFSQGTVVLELLLHLPHLLPHLVELGQLCIQLLLLPGSPGLLLDYLELGPPSFGGGLHHVVGVTFLQLEAKDEY